MNAVRSAWWALQYLLFFERDTIIWYRVLFKSAFLQRVYPTDWHNVESKAGLPTWPSLCFFSTLGPLESARTFQPCPEIAEVERLRFLCCLELRRGEVHWGTATELPGWLHRSIGQTSQGSFSAVSKRKFARKYAFESSRRDLHNALLCTALKSHFFEN